MGCWGTWSPGQGWDSGLSLAHAGHSRAPRRACSQLDSEMVPPFPQNTLYLEALPALKFPLAGLGLRAGWDAGHTRMQDAPRRRLRLQELLAPHTPQSCQAGGRGIQKSMFNIITGLRFGSASRPVTLPSPSSPLWEHSQDGRAGGECQRGHSGESLRVPWAPCCHTWAGHLPQHPPCSARDAP